MMMMSGSAEFEGWVSDGRKWRKDGVGPDGVQGVVSEGKKGWGWTLSEDGSMVTAARNCGSMEEAVAGAEAAAVSAPFRSKLAGLRAWRAEFRSGGGSAAAEE